jgi:zinc-ribbon domain
MFCRHCGSQVRDAAAFCTKCGAAIAATSLVPRHSQTNIPTRIAEVLPRLETQWRCPNCNSENFQKLSVIYQGGTTSNQSVGIGVFAGRVGGAVGGGTSRSTLASYAAPPSKPSGCLMLLVVWIVCLIVIMGFRLLLPNLPALYGVIVILLLIGGFYLASPSSQFDDRMDEWHRSYLCHRCGHVFQK